MTEVRLVRAEEMEQAARLSDSIFRDREQISMRTAFPDVFSPSLSQSYAAFEDGKMVSFMGLVPGMVQIGKASVAVYLLGSVCTHPDYRGKGYASRILNQVLSHLDTAGASLLLVSGGRSLYTRANCLPFGSIQRFTLDDSSVPALLEHLGDDSLQLREMEETDWLSMRRLAGERTAYFEQSVTDLANLIKNEALVSCLKMKHRVLVAARAGVPAAYAVVAVPSPPLKNKRVPFVVEYAGEAGAVALLAVYAMERYELEGLRMAVSRHEHDLLHVLEAMAGLGSQAEKNQGTVKIISAPRFLSQLRPFWNGTRSVIAGALQMEPADGEFTRISFGGSTVCVNAGALISLIFDGEIPQGADPLLEEALAELFPIPFPFTDGLNYI